MPDANSGPAATPIPSPAPPTTAVGLPWLVGDIGGTNARFGWVERIGPGGLPQVVHVRTLPVAMHAGLAAAARAYLAELAAGVGSPLPPPRAAALAVATPLIGDRVEMTNSLWAFSRAGLLAELGLQRLRVLNDFEALALSLPGLQPQQLQWRGLPPRPGGTMAVIGPGTGLGVAGVVQTPVGWQALPGEGGHVSLAAADDFEARLLAHVRQLHGHVSAERLLSGIGLPVLHHALAEVLGQPAPALGTTEIVRRGVDGSDALCGRVLDTFCALLGGFAGNVALTLGARGGVYIGGGIVPRLGERFFSSRFRRRFEAKGRFDVYLRDIPTPLITDTLAALAGAAAALAAPQA